MMVEAESTEQTWDLVARRQDRADRGGRRRRPRGRQAVHQGLCDAQAELAAKFAKDRRRVPDLPGLPDDVYAAVCRGGHRRAVRGHVDRRQARPRGTPPRPSRTRSRAPARAEFEGREKEITGAYRALTKKLVRQKILTDKSASTAAG